MIFLDRGFRKTVVFVVLATMLAPAVVTARTHKGDVLIARARAEEAKDTTAGLDAAYQLAMEAFATDRTDIGYQLDLNRLRSFSAQYHVYDGQLARDKGQLTDAVREFERAAALDPASIVAPQELARTKDLMKTVASSNGMLVPEMLSRPLPRKLRQDEEKFTNSTPIPQLKVQLKQQLPIVKVNQQGPSEVYVTLGKEAGVRVLFDSEYQNRSLGLNQTLDFRGLSLEQALDYVALMSKSFWKALSADTIFVSNDDQQHRGSYEEQITKAFYLTNAPVAQEVSDIANTIQRVTDMKKLFVHPAQNVIIARGDADRIALAEKIAADLDKPRAEIIIDVLILSVSKDWTRNLGVALGLDGLSTKFAGAGGATTLALNALQNLKTSSYSVTLPSATLSALLSTSGTKVLDKAELRTVEGQRSSLKIGTREPYATGSFQAGNIGSGVNTQFQFFDVGLNIDVIAKVHEPDEVSLHIESDTSSVQSRVDLGGGITQPVIAQRKRVADVRVKEGEINFWDIVTQRSETRSQSGVPGLSQIPLLGRFFSQEHLDRSEQQVLTLLTPHIIRAPDIRNVNLIGVPSGSDQVIRMRYGSKEEQPVAAQGKDKDRTIELAAGSAPVNAPSAAMGMGMPMGMGGMQQQPGMGMPMGMGGMQQQPGMGMAGMTGMGAVRPPGMGGVPQQPGVQQGGSPRIFFGPSKVQATVGGQFTVDVSLADSPALNESTITVVFDPTALKFVSAAAGGLGAASTPALGHSPNDGMLVLKSGPLPGPGSVMRLTFVSAKAGTTFAAISTAKAVSTAAQDLPVRTENLEVTSTGGN